MSSYIETMQEQKVPLADILVLAEGFRFGKRSNSFCLKEKDGRKWVFHESTACVRVTVRVRQVGNTFVISNQVSNFGHESIHGMELLEPVHMGFNLPANRWRHIYANGGTAEGCYPPSAYQTRECAHSLGNFRIESHPGGRSSNLHLPFLISLASHDDEAEGMFCGMEWSGTWYMTIEKDGDNRSSLGLGIKVADLVLAPAECLNLPDVHIGFFRGGPEAGTNVLRRYLCEQVCPQLDGKPVLPRVSYDHWFGIGDAINEQMLKCQAQRAAELGVEVFVVDAGWFPGGFPRGVGNWRTDMDKFPSGLGSLAEFTRSLGLDFGLWFEIERAHHGTQAIIEHPELFFSPPETLSGDSARAGLEYHLNLARRDAQDWAIEIISSMIEKLDLRWSRWDYNIDPMPFWREVDPTLKIQFEYFSGLYRVLDTLMAKHPKWMVEGCASGGRRIDMGTMRRAHTYWFSDLTEIPSSCRYMQARANRFVPGHLLNSSVAVEWKNGDGHFNDNAILSRMLGKLSFDGDIASWTSSLTDRMATRVAEFKVIRHLLRQDFYQLLPQPTTVEDWDAVQFVSYARDESVVLAFSGSRARSGLLKVKGLEPECSYRVTQSWESESTCLTGGQLMCNGLVVNLAAESGGLWWILAAR